MIIAFSLALFACAQGHSALPAPPPSKSIPSVSKAPAQHEAPMVSRSEEATGTAATLLEASGTNAVNASTHEPSKPETPSVEASLESTLAVEATTLDPDQAHHRQEIHFQDHYPDARSVRLLAWKKVHRATGPTFDQRCWELGSRVGVPEAPGLLCLAKSDDPPFTLARVYRLDGLLLREVWSATIRTWTNWLDLTPLLSEDGRMLVLHDRFPRACHGALREAHAKAMAHKEPPSAELLGPACAAVGEYTFERGKYRRSSPPVDYDPFTF